MRQLHILIFSAFFAGTLSAQQLVPNGNFNSFTTCPDTISQLTYASPWMAPNASSPDFFHGCANYGSGWMFAQPNPAPGNGYVGIFAYSKNPQGGNYREYIGVQLNSPMLPNTTYTVSFRVKSSLGVWVNTFIDNIGAVFSDTVWNISGHQPIVTNPDVSNDHGNYFTQNEWTTVTKCYQANGSEQYIYLGNFVAQNQVSIQGTPGSWRTAYVYIDDISVMPYEYPTDIIAADSVGMCDGGFASLAAYHPFENYQWNTGQYSDQINVNQPGEYIVTAYEGTCAQYDTVNVYVDHIPAPVTTGSTDLCPNEVYNVTIASGYNAAWDDGSILTSRDLDTEGTHILTTSSDFCSRTDLFHINTILPPSDTFPLEITKCFHQTIYLGTTCEDCIYSWNTGETDPSIAINDEGLYEIYVENGCGNITSSTLVINDECEVMIPTAISPNGDGSNDIWELAGVFDNNLLSLRVFNRYGTVVHQQINEYEHWNGKNNGKAVPVGTYFYEIELTEGKYTGWLVVMR